METVNAKGDVTVRIETLYDVLGAFFCVGIAWFIANHLGWW